MSDEVRSNSNPVPPDSGGLAIDPVDGPTGLDDIEFPTPDIDLVDSGPVEAGPMAGILGMEPEKSGGGVTVLPNKDISLPRSAVATDLMPPRPSERPPPPSQRVATQHRLEAMATPIPPPSPGRTLPPPGIATLPAPAPLLADPDLPADAPVVPPAGMRPDRSPFAEPLEAAPFTAAPSSAASPWPGLSPAVAPPAPSELDFAPPSENPRPFVPPSPVPPPAASPHVSRASASGVSSERVSGFATEPAPAPRMLSEPVPLLRPTSGAPAKSTLRPGLVEPKRIIEVLGSNVPVLDSALEEDAIEDLDETEAHELSETPAPEAAPVSLDTELEVNVVIEDFPTEVEDARSIDGAARFDAAAVDGPASVDAAALERDDEPVSTATAPASPPSDGAAPSASPDGPETPNRRVKAPPNKRRRPPPPSSRSQEMRKAEPPAPLGARKWWEEMFSEEFLRAIPILSPRQLEREVNFIDEALAVARGGRILDLACGAGQHAVELATRSYDVVGFDLSQSQLDWAGGLAQERNQRLQFTYGDMRELAYSEAFDAVYSWNTSFGFFEEEKNVDVAQRVFRALRPGGRFLLDVINRDFVVAQQPGQTWFEGDGCVCIDDVSIDFITSRMKVKRTLMLTSGKNRECNYSLRIYGLHELGKILHDVGFKVLNVSGRPEMPGVFFGATSPRIIILAVKP
jgi:SAM-dependent methyltransferase